MSESSVKTWMPSRADGLKRLDAFLPHAGLDYAKMRNFDFGPTDRSNVSALSPYVRHRLLLEEELVNGAIAQHGWDLAEKFVQEVAWRTYFKGWLEQHPSAWTNYRKRVETLYQGLDHDPSRRDRWEQAVEGTTGIACFDAWSHELLKYGWLHNHTRMWHASLWIFTLKLPWELGADFYLRHLLDADPASNTLSWRWVAGIQTRGKTYLARTENIAKYTNGRFQPTELFAESAEGVKLPPPEAKEPLPRPESAADLPSGLLIHEDDLAINGFAFSPLLICSVALGMATENRSPLGTSPVAQGFANGAAEDGLARAAEHYGAPAETFTADWNTSALDWIRQHDIKQVITSYAPIGPSREKLDALEGRLRAEGVPLVRVQRPWDQVLWPLVKAGFYPFKETFPSALEVLKIPLTARSAQGEAWSR